MRICRVMSLFVVFAGFTVPALPKDELRKPLSSWLLAQPPWDLQDRQDDGPACRRRGTGRSPANPREAVLAADLITASLSRLLVVPGQYAEGKYINDIRFPSGFGIPAVHIWQSPNILISECPHQNHYFARARVERPIFC